MSAFTNGLSSTPGSGSSKPSAPRHTPRLSQSTSNAIIKGNTKGTLKKDGVITTATGTTGSTEDEEGIKPLLKRLNDATSPAEIRAALESLHAREQKLACRLGTLATLHTDLDRDLLRLDGLRATLGAQVIATRTISNTMLSGAADTARRLSGRVRQLDLEKARVGETLKVVEQVAELKACVAGVTGSMGAPQDWEAAARYLSRASAIPDDILRCGFANAVVPTVETPDSPSATLEAAREGLRVLFLREFDRAAGDGDDAKVTRFFKLFPLIGRGDVGLDVYGRYVCQGVAGHARATLRGGGGNGAGATRDGLFYAGALTKLFEHVAEIVAHHGGLVERHYGSGKMVRVIERLQMEVDVQGGIILDSWSDERGLDRKLTDIKSYPWSFLRRSFLPQQQQQRSSAFGVSTPRGNSPAVGGSGGGGSGGGDNQRNSEDEGVNMREVDGLLTEIAFMLGKWSLYSRFVAGKCRDPEVDDDAPLAMPPVLLNSNLQRKVSAKLISPYDLMTTFYFRRSVEKAFQLDESPPGLSLNMTKPMDGNPPYIISAVDDVMYIANTVLQRSMATSQVAVVSSAAQSVSRVLVTDFVGLIQRRMKDETYPSPAVSGGFPPEDKIVAFVVLNNSLDIAREYLSRIISGRLGVVPGEDAAKGAGVTAAPPPPGGSPSDLFPLERDAAVVTRDLRKLESTFAFQAGELLRGGVDVLFKEVVRPRLRPILTETFKDADYSLTESELLELAATEEDADGTGLDKGSSDQLLQLKLEQVGRRFEHRWDGLMQPLGRLMTPRTHASLLDSSAKYLARVLEKRIWLSAGKVNEFGAVRMERDFSAIVSAVAKGNYALRESFARVSQALMVANMEEDEWDELMAEEEAGAAGGADEGGGMRWVLSEEERRRARNLVKAS